MQNLGNIRWIWAVACLLFAPTAFAITQCQDVIPLFLKQLSPEPTSSPSRVRAQILSTLSQAIRMDWDDRQSLISAWQQTHFIRTGHLPGLTGDKNRAGFFSLSLYDAATVLVHMAETHIQKEATQYIQAHPGELLPEELLVHFRVYWALFREYTQLIHPTPFLLSKYQSHRIIDSGKRIPQPVIDQIAHIFSETKNMHTTDQLQLLAEWEQQVFKTDRYLPGLDSMYAGVAYVDLNFAQRRNTKGNFHFTPLLAVDNFLEKNPDKLLPPEVVHLLRIQIILEIFYTDSTVGQKRKVTDSLRPLLQGLPPSAAKTQLQNLFSVTTPITVAIRDSTLSQWEGFELRQNHCLPGLQHDTRFQDVKFTRLNFTDQQVVINNVAQQIFELAQQHIQAPPGTPLPQELVNLASVYQALLDISKEITSQ